MKISIITVSYNSALTINHTIDSVLNQSYDNIEHIIIDGNSTDGTSDIVNSYKREKIKFISEPDKGIYDALNKGIRMATGDVIGFLHADDVFAGSDIVQSIAEVFETYNPDSCYGDLVYVKKENTDKAVRFWKSGKFNAKKIASGWMPPHPTFYAKREIYEKYGSFNLDYKISSDYDCMLRLLNTNRISTFYLPITMVKMRLGGISNRSFSTIVQKSMEDIKAMRSNGLNFIPAIVRKNVSKLNQFSLSAEIPIN